MRPSKRYATNKHRSAGNFRRNIKKTKSINLTPTPMRGGFRL